MRRAIQSGLCVVAGLLFFLVAVPLAASPLVTWLATFPTSSLVVFVPLAWVGIVLVDVSTTIHAPDTD